MKLCRDNSKTLFLVYQNKINFVCIKRASFIDQINQKVPLHAAV